MAKKMIRPIRTETEYDEALEEIERYFENEPKPGTQKAGRFDLLALIVEDYERKSWPIERGATTTWASPGLKAAESEPSTSFSTPPLPERPPSFPRE